jgi:hypothetical protein
MKNKINFKSYVVLTEQEDNRKVLTIKEAADLVKAQGKEWERHIGGFTKGKTDWIFYRGVKIPHSEYSNNFLVKTRRDRKPLDTNVEIHKIADDYMLEKFGVRFRSQGVFTLRSESLASFYGNTFMLFPLGKVNYIWSETHMDLGAALLGKEAFLKDYPEKTAAMIKSIIDDAKYHFNKDLQELKHPEFVRNEVVVDCESYVLVNPLHTYQFLKHLFNDNED